MLNWIIRSLVWGAPGQMLNRQTLQIMRMFSAPKGNALPLVKYDILWAIPMSFSGIYLQLFMREQGLTEVEIGTVASAQLTAQILGALLGGYVAERFGRLRTITWTDGIVWPIAFLLFAFADGYLSFLAGAILLGSVFLLVPSWVSLYIEDSPEKIRPYLFALRQLPWFVGGLLASLSGFVVKIWGVSFTCRIVFGFSILLTIFAVWYRRRFMTDPDPKPRPFEPSFDEFEHLALTHWRAFKTMVRRRHMLIFLLMQMLAMAGLTIGGTYNYLYLTDPMGVGLPKSWVAVLPVFSGSAVVATTLLVLPFLTRLNVHRAMFLGIILMILSAYTLLLAPHGSLSYAMIASAAGSGGFAIYSPALNAHWANMMNDRERARMLALTTVLTMLAAVPAPTIAGGFYAINPRGPLALILTCYVALVTLVFWAATSKTQFLTEEQRRALVMSRYPRRRTRRAKQ